MRKPIFFAFLVTCITLAGVYGADQPASLPASTAPSQQTSLVKHGSLSLDIDVQGALDPVDPFEVRLRFKAYAGMTSPSPSIAANGSAVKKGDVLLEIDPAPMKRTLAAAANEALVARANLEKTQADAKVAEQVDALGASSAAGCRGRSRAEREMV